MAESSLALAYDDLRKEVAWELGYGTTIANWTAGQADVIARTQEKYLAALKNLLG